MSMRGVEQGKLPNDCKLYFFVILDKYTFLSILNMLPFHVILQFCVFDIVNLEFVKV